MPFTIIRQDITKMDVDAIVNAANNELQMGGGVCGAIFKAAGASNLRAACDKLAPIQTGEAVITPGFALPAKFVIHTAGPVYQDGAHGEKELLTACYTNALNLALEYHCESIAFPLISSGIYGYPKLEALWVASAAIRQFLEDHEINVFLAVFDKIAFTVSQELLGYVQAYVDTSYVRSVYDETREMQRPHPRMSKQQPRPYNAVEMPASMAPPTTPLKDWLGRLDEPFSTTLLRLIDAKGKTDVEVYKRANLDRKLFSKIRSSESYMPSKRTAIALAVALQLTERETVDLLERAGYSLSNSQLFDVIIRYFLSHQRYDIFEINEVLFSYDQPLLGS